MSEQTTSTESGTEGVSTPPTETTTAPDSPSTQTATESVSNPLLETDVWGDFGKKDDEKKEEEKVEEKVGAKPDEVKTEAEKPAETEASSDSDLSEDAILEEIFSDEELGTVDKKDIVDSQPSRRTKAAAAQNADYADVVRTFRNKEVPISEVLSKFEELSPERASEMRKEAAHKLVDSNPEQTFQRAFVNVMKAENPNYEWTPETLPTLKEFIDFKNGKGSETAPSSSLTAEKVAQATAELDKTLGFNWRDPANDENFIDEEKAMVQALRAMEETLKAKDEKDAALEAEKSEQAKKIEELEKKLGEVESGFKETTNVKLQETAVKLIDDYRAEFQQWVMPHIAKQSGLEISDTDTPEMRAYKERKLEFYTGTEYHKANREMSHFEDFATNQSSVADQIKQIYDRLGDAQIKQANALLAGDSSAAAKAKADAKAERVGLAEMYKKANAEYKAAYIEPDLSYISSLSSSLSSRQQEAANRVEVPNGQAGTFAPPQPEYESADDIWGNMDTDFAKRQSFRAA